MTPLSHFGHLAQHRKRLAQPRLFGQLLEVSRYHFFRRVFAAYFHRQIKRQPSFRVVSGADDIVEWRTSLISRFSVPTP